MGSQIPGKVYARQRRQSTTPLQAVGTMMQANVTLTPHLAPEAGPPGRETRRLCFRSSILDS